MLNFRYLHEANPHTTWCLCIILRPLCNNDAHHSDTNLVTDQVISFRGKVNRIIPIFDMICVTR